MDNYHINKKQLFAFILIILIIINPIQADELIKITTLEQLNNLEKEWECELKGTLVNNFKSHLILDEEINIKKIKAKSREGYCPNEPALFKGKFKNGKLFLKSSYMPSPCAQDLRSIFSIYKNEAGDYYMKGKHISTTYDGLRRSYTSTCIQVSN